MGIGIKEWLPVPKFLEANKGKIDRNLLYRLISEGSVPSIRLGTKKLLVPSNLFDLLAESQDHYPIEPTS